MSKKRELDSYSNPSPKHLSLFFLKIMCIDYTLTLIFTIIFAFIAYKLILDNNQLRTGAIIIYTISNLLSGFICAKSTKTKNILYGLIIGIFYLIILLLVSYIMHNKIFEYHSMFIPAAISSIVSASLGLIIS